MSNTSETSLRAHLSKLAIRLDAFAISSSDIEVQDSQSTTEDATHPRDLVFSGDVQEPDDPLIIVHDSDPEGDDGSEGSTPYVFVLWKANAFLSKRSF